MLSRLRFYRPTFYPFAISVFCSVYDEKPDISYRHPQSRHNSGYIYILEKPSIGQKKESQGTRRSICPIQPFLWTRHRRRCGRREKKYNATFDSSSNFSSERRWGYIVFYGERAVHRQLLVERGLWRGCSVAPELGPRPRPEAEAARDLTGGRGSAWRTRATISIGCSLVTRSLRRPTS